MIETKWFLILAEDCAGWQSTLCPCFFLSWGLFEAFLIPMWHYIYILELSNRKHYVGCTSKRGQGVRLGYLSRH